MQHVRTQTKLDAANRIERAHRTFDPAPDRIVDSPVPNIRGFRGASIPAYPSEGSGNAASSPAQPGLSPTVPATRDAPIPPLQAKLSIGNDDDALEREADRVADAVVGAPDRAADTADAMSEAGAAVVEGAEDEETVQRFADPGHPAVAARYEHAIHAAQTGGHPLSRAEQSFMETRFGTDFSKVRVHDGASADAAAKAVGARAFTVGSDVVFRSAAYRDGTAAGRWLLAHELTHVVQQRNGGAGRDGLVQRKPQKTKPLSFRFTVTPESTTDGTGFRILVCRKILGVDAATAAEYATRFQWSGPHSTNGVTKADVGRPIVINIDASIYRSVKGAGPTEAEATDASGRAAGSSERAAEFGDLPEAEKKSLNEEVDRRFWSRSGYKPGQKLGKSQTDTQMAQLWLDIRDEVLAQRQALQGLPPPVQQALGGIESFKPEDYPQLARIAGILSPAEWADYLSRVTARTASLDQLEASVEAYQAQKRKRDAEAGRFKDLQIKLAGTSSLYRAYKDYLKKRDAALGTSVMHPMSDVPAYVPATQGQLDAADAAERSLTAALVAANFKGGIPEFAASLDKFVAAFETQAVNIGVTALDQYESFLFRQGELYQDDKVIGELYDSLAPYRAAYSEIRAQERIIADSHRAERSRQVPGSFQHTTDPKLAKERQDAWAQVDAQKAKGIAAVRGLGGTHPIFKEDHLPLKRRIPKQELAEADKAGLKSLLAKHIADRTEDVRSTRDNLRSDHELIYKMGQLMGEAKRRLEVTPGSMFEELIQEKADRIGRDEALVAALEAVLAIAFTIMTFGTGAIVVVGALGALGVGGLVTYGEFEKFRIASQAAGSGLSSQEPSPVWLVLSIVGTALDAGGAIQAIRAVTPAAKALEAVEALTPAAKALEAGGELKAFHEAVAAIEKQGVIDAKIARSVDAAGEAQKAYGAAAKDLRAALFGKLYSFPGPLADPDVYQAVVRMAAAKVRQGLESIEQFILELNKMRLDAKLAELSGEELALATRAFLEGSESAKVGTYSTRIKWSIHTIDARPHGEGFWGKRIPQSEPRVNAYELKVNPNNESFYLPHPDGGFVQFENVTAHAVQDGKLVLTTERSMYHVADMPPFARVKVLQEARRQVAAAEKAGLAIEWLVSDQKAITQLGDLFKNEGIPITLKLLLE